MLTQLRIDPSIALSAALLCGACPTRIAPPTALISTTPRSPTGDAGACDAVESLSTRVEVAPALHATCSSDPQGHVLSYRWSVVDQPSGASPTLRDPAVASPTLLVDLPGKYRVSLIVSNGTLTSEPAYVTLDASACGAHPPVITDIARAPEGRVKTGDVVVLNPGVHDADDDAPCSVERADDLSFKWTFVRLPPGSEVRFNAATARAPSFVPDVAGEYEARLEVTDASGRKATRTVDLRVGP